MASSVLAAITAVVSYPLFRHFQKRMHGRVRVAAGFTTGIVVTALTVPLGLAILVASFQLYALATNVAEDPRWRAAIDQTGQRAKEHSETLVQRAVDFTNEFLPPDQQRTAQDILRDVRDHLRTSLRGLGDRSLGVAAGTTFGVLADLAGTLVAALLGLLIYVLAVYYFLADGRRLRESTERLVPVHAEYQQEMWEEFSKVVRSVVVATFLAAFAQGLATAAALWFFGFPHVFVLFVLATLASLIPIIGAWLVWFPCVVILFVDGHWLQGTFLFLYGAILVGFLDNIIRTYLLNTDVKLHPLLAFISILGGMQAMGLWGVFIGPIIAACLYALVKIFNVELSEFSKDQQRASGSGTP